MQSSRAHVSKAIPFALASPVFSLVFSLVLALVLLAGCGEQKTNGGMSSQSGSNDAAAGTGTSTGSGNGTSGGTSTGGSGTGSTGTPTASTSDPNCRDDLGSTDPKVSASRVEICVLVNKARAEFGVAPLVLTSALSQVAQAHTEDMIQKSYFSHTNLEGKSPFDRMRAAGITFGYAAENIATGASTATNAMTMWMNSAGHRTNILNPNYRKLGVGFSQKTWTQTFTD